MPTLGASFANGAIPPIRAVGTNSVTNAVLLAAAGTSHRWRGIRGQVNVAGSCVVSFDDGAGNAVGPVLYCSANDAQPIDIDGLAENSGLRVTIASLTGAYSVVIDRAYNEKIGP